MARCDRATGETGPLDASAASAPPGTTQGRYGPRKALLRSQGPVAVPRAPRPSAGASLPPGGAASYQLTGADVTDDAYVHPEAIGEGRLQVDVARLVLVPQLAHVDPIQLFQSPQLHLVGALQRPHRQPGRTRQDEQRAAVPGDSQPSSFRDAPGSLVPSSLPAPPRDEKPAPSGHSLDKDSTEKDKRHGGPVSLI